MIPPGPIILPLGGKEVEGVRRCESDDLDGDVEADVCGISIDIEVDEGRVENVELWVKGSEVDQFVDEPEGAEGRYDWARRGWTEVLERDRPTSGDEGKAETGG